MEEEEASTSSPTPFAPRLSLARTPPSGLAPPFAGLETPIVPPRPRPAPPSTSSQTPAPTVAGKRPLPSPEERRPNDVVRVCRSASVAPTHPTTAATGPARPEEPEEVEAAQEECFSLAEAPKAELLDKVHKDLGRVMSTVTGQTSRLNKDAVNTVSISCQNILAVIAALTLRLGEAEIEAKEANLRAAKTEQELLKVKMSAQTSAVHASSAAGGQSSYASTLKLAKKAEPMRIPAAQGPVLAFYPAPEHAASFKSAEDTKAALKKAINPQDHQVQVDHLRKVGNAGVVVQTTSTVAAEKLKKATPLTLRVTEPKRRSPLVCLRYVDGEPDLDALYGALYEQNFVESEWSLERLRSQSKLAFKKRGRGTTSFVLECSPPLREALLGKSKVYIGWSVIEVVDYLSVTCCRKCHTYGHPEKYCRSTEVFCGRCGNSGHKREDCKAETECCATCKRFSRPEAASHMTASATCPARLHAESRTLASTNYGQ